MFYEAWSFKNEAWAYFSVKTSDSHNLAIRSMRLSFKLFPNFFVWGSGVQKFSESSMKIYLGHYFMVHDMKYNFSLYFCATPGH